MPVPKARWRFGSPSDIEAIRIGKLRRVAIGGADADVHVGSGGHGDAAERGIFGRSAVAELVRAFHAQKFFDRRFDCLRMAAQVAHDVGMADEKIDPIADQIGRRLVPGVEQKNAIVDELEF